MNIVQVLKTFDIFNSETVQFFKEKAVNIFMLETFSKNQSGINFISDKNSININVVNKPKVYNFMISAKRRIDERKKELHGDKK